MLLMVFARIGLCATIPADSAPQPIDLKQMNAYLKARIGFLEANNRLLELQGSGGSQKDWQAAGSKLQDSQTALQQAYAQLKAKGCGEGHTFDETKFNSGLDAVCVVSPPAPASQ
jgi:hypothetical protein